MDDVKPDQTTGNGTGSAGASLAAIDGQIAIVTGGGAGIGALTALHLSDAGAFVVLADIDEEAVRRTAESIGYPETTLARAVDVSDPEEVAQLIEDVVTRYGRLDLLINNAGVATVDPLERISIESWRRTFAVNVEGALLTMQAAFAAMRDQRPLPGTGCRGKIINMSSPASEVGRPLLAAYGASKAAVSHLSKSAAARWGDHQISTTIVYPGSVTGAMWPRLGYELAAAEGRQPEEIVAERIAWTPSGRLQEPSEIAEIVLYVANFNGMGLNGRTVWTEPHISVG